MINIKRLTIAFTNPTYFDNCFCKSNIFRITIAKNNNEYSRCVFLNFRCASSKIANVLSNFIENTRYLCYRLHFCLDVFIATIVC